MASEWPLLPLGEMTVNHDSKRVPVKEADRRPGPYPYYGASGVVDTVDRYLFDGEYLLIAEDGENLRTRNMPIAFRAKGKFWVNNHAHIVQGNERARTRYLEYAVLAADIAPYLTGAVMPKLTQGNLNKILLPCPSLCEQDAIVNVLGAFDDRIDNLRATNATLEAIAQALFKSWFVDFDPVHTKAEGRAPEGMDTATAALFPSEFEDSELGPVPKGWDTATLNDLADLNASRWTKRSHPDTVSYLDLSGVTRNRIDPPTEYEFDGAPSRARNHLRHGDTIVGTVRPANRAFAYISQPKANLTGSTGFAVLSPKQPYLASYVYLAATMDASIDRLANLADGAAYPAVRPSVVAETPCVIPPVAVLENFSTFAMPLLEKIAQNSASVRTLADLRDTLLPRLISGKLRVGEAAYCAREYWP